MAVCQYCVLYSADRQPFCFYLPSTPVTELIAIIITAALANNFVLVNYLGLCPFMGVSKNTEHLRGMCLAICAVLVISTAITSPLRLWLLPAVQLEYLYPLVSIVVVALSVQLIELLTRWRAPLIYASLGIYLPLVTTNCAILGVILLNRYTQTTLLESLATALGAGLGFALVLYVFSHLRESINQERVPVFLRGTPIALITAGLMALAMTAFSAK